MTENKRRPSRYPRTLRESEPFEMASTATIDLLLLSGAPASSPLGQPNIYSPTSFPHSEMTAFQPEMSNFVPYSFDQAPPSSQQASLDPFFGNQTSSTYASSFVSTNDPYDNITSVPRAGATYFSNSQWLTPPAQNSSSSSPSRQGLEYQQIPHHGTMDSSTGSLANSATSNEFDDTSPTRDPKDLSPYGIQNPNGTWRCAYPGCSSAAVFRRGCDLRKHFNRHRKYLFCRYEGCPQAVRGGFSSKKDRDRHEAKHNPEIPCEWEGCHRVFSRMDNMKDHVRRIHRRHE